MRGWFAVALLSASWLFGLGYFDPANLVAWMCLIAAAVLLLADAPLRLPSRSRRWIALFLLLPAVAYAPVPHRAIMGLPLVGLLASLVPWPASWLRRVARGAILAGGILLAQGLVLGAYQWQTAQGHELPAWLGRCLAAVLRLLAADAVFEAGWLVVRNASTQISVAATWELLFAPGTVCFLAGAAVMLLVRSLQSVQMVDHQAVWRRFTAVGTIVVAWVPLRAGLLIAMVLQQRLRATVVTYPNVGDTLVSTWMHALLLLVPALIAGWLIPLRSSLKRSARRQPGKVSHRSPVRESLAYLTVGLAIGGVTFLQLWFPVGSRQDGRVMFVERHSTWEPTTEPYGTEVYGEAGSYNYAAVYAYCDQYYDMSRLLDDDPINDETLATCDVLVIKTPTSRYAAEEVEAIARFVGRGGALLLIGDHTNVFNMNTYLNDISRHFGFTFRNDLLFRIGSPYRQDYYPPQIGHPIMQHVPPMNFAVSCSIDPGDNPGTMVVRNAGLYNLPPAYHESNYHPQAEYRPNMQYGAWCQMWATSYGKGRVVAFSDSTLFSNFCVFQPGKTELFMGMLEWLNHRSKEDGWQERLFGTPLPQIALCGLLLFGMWLAWSATGSWLVLFAAGATGWAASGWLVGQIHQRSFPLPPKHSSLEHVVIDRTLSNVPLFTGAFADAPDGNGYGLLEQWIPRLGNFTSRRRGDAVFQGDGIVTICPTRLPSLEYRAGLIEWVRGGGRLVVFDSPDVEDSTANSVLMLFGLQSTPGAPEPDIENAPVQLTEQNVETPLAMSCAVAGGEPIATWGENTVAARARVGQGSVTAIGFGSLFADANMGYHWLVEPDEELRGRYELLYGLLRSGLER